MTLLVATDPRLAFTHLPLTHVPAGVVGVHGLVHNNEPVRSGLYVNICVEHTQYRPLPLQAVVRLATELIDGRGAGGRDDSRAPQGDRRAGMISLIHHDARLKEIESVDPVTDYRVCCKRTPARWRGSGAGSPRSRGSQIDARGVRPRLSNASRPLSGGAGRVRCRTRRCPERHRRPGVKW